MWEGPRIVKVFVEQDPLNLILVRILDAPQLSRLSAALRDYVRQDDEYVNDAGPEPGGLSEFLEARGFTVPCSYSTLWPFTAEIGQ
ncbi:MAG: hypothetical protein HY713_00090 [candidate division NC10 bacterium]|nr:hypothetical protein [candidate division NC10 bacterium]